MQYSTMMTTQRVTWCQLLQALLPPSQLLIVSRFIKCQALKLCQQGCRRTQLGIIDYASCIRDVVIHIGRTVVDRNASRLQRMVHLLGDIVQLNAVLDSPSESNQNGPMSYSNVVYGNRTVPAAPTAQENASYVLLQVTPPHPVRCNMIVIKSSEHCFDENSSMQH